jgi:hypothetical protein
MMVARHTPGLANAAELIDPRIARNSVGGRFSYQAKHAMSPVGTFAKSRPALNLSAFRGRPEVIGTQSEWRD